MGGFLEPSGEGDRERVQRGLSPHHPACPFAASGEVSGERFLEPVERASQSGDLRDRAGRERVQQLDRDPPSHSMGLVVHRP